MRTLTRLLTASIVVCACDQQGEARATARTEVGASRPSAAAAPAAALEPTVLADGTGPRQPANLEPTPNSAPNEDRPDDEVPIPEEPAPPEAPADYGVIKPSSPAHDPSSLTLHGLAGYEVVAVHDRADGESPKLGYLRLGTRMMVGEKVSGPGCPKGWHALALGGFACASKGLVVDADREPPLPNPPPAVRADQPLPYDYAYVKRWNSPMWWRVPTAEEVAAAEVIRTGREQERLASEAAAKGLPAPAAPAKPKTTTPVTPATVATPDPKDDDPIKSLPSVHDETADADPKAAAPKAVVKPDAKPDTKPDAKPDAPAAEPIAAVRLPLKPEKSWLERGFYVSVGNKITEEGRTWWQTARGGYVDVTHAYKYDAKDFEGMPLAEEATFPFGFVMAETTKLLELQPDGKITAVGTLDRRAFVDLDEEIEIAGKTYMTTAQGQMIRKADLRMADPQPLPKGLQPWERWVDVSLEKQILVAYQGDRPVFVSLVSTGKKGSKDEPFVTPTGRWRIRSKHISTTMDGNTASDGNYSIQDVPWTMFFEGSFALHGAFWHQGFGRPRSHGCVNLGPSAARWLFYWTTPFLPEGWHGVHAHAGSPGTTVIVRE